MKSSEYSTVVTACTDDSALRWPTHRRIEDVLYNVTQCCWVIWPQKEWLGRLTNGVIVLQFGGKKKKNKTKKKHTFTNREKYVNRKL